MAIGIALFALIVTVDALLPQPIFARVTLLVMAAFLWILAVTWFGWWQQWKLVVAWKREREALQRQNARPDP